MSWEQYDHWSLFDSSIEIDRNKSIKVNQFCYIRKNHKCGKLLGASKSCFIACPTDDNIETILELLSEKLTKVGIEPIIAVKERAYGQDIFCTKICGKIIESKFCVTILDDTIKDNINIPNPNVYYEYGLMTSLGKHIIPLQKENQKLAFNIQSYDTIKYNSKNVGGELDRAIKDAIQLTEPEKRKTESSCVTEKTILRKLELSDFIEKDDKWFLSDVIDDTNFKGFGHTTKQLYMYVGKVDTEEDITNYSDDLNIVLFRTEKKKEELEQNHKKYTDLLAALVQENETKQKQIEISSKYSSRDFNPRRDQHKRELEDINSKLSNMNTVLIVFVVNPKLIIKDFSESIEKILSQYPDYKLIISNNGLIEYEDIRVELETNLH
ncbi:MAG: hypothetical protein V1720_07360 [bacterium]